MRKKINGVLYDTATASLIAETENMTTLSGKLSLKLFTADYVKNERTKTDGVSHYMHTKQKGS